MDKTFHQIIATILIANLCIAGFFLMTSCNTSRKISEATEETKTLIEEGYTPKQIKEMRELTKDDSIMDKLMSERILLLFAVGALILIFCGAYEAKKLNMMGAAAYWISAAVCVVLPACIVIFLKAMTFLLYMFCGVILIGVAVLLYVIWRKYHHRTVAFKDVVSTVEELKTAYPEEWETFAETIQHDETTKRAVKEVKKTK